MNSKKIKARGITGVLLLLLASAASAQTDNDAIMMNKHQWCNGVTYMHGQWHEYWEGTNKRDNANMGTVSTQAIMGMSNYGITDNLNVMVSAPYIWTHATQGTLSGFKGFQDISFHVKWKGYTTPLGKGKFSIFGVAGLTTPLSDYSIDLLPMSIGVHTTNLTFRVMPYYRQGIFFARASAAYVWRSNTKLDRTAYYSTDQHNTNEIYMADQLNFNGALGIYKKYLIAELDVDNVTTLSGSDIRKNEFPFPGNKMDMTSVGVYAKYTLPFCTHISLLGRYDYTVAGRNVGQTSLFTAGVFYAFYLKHDKGFEEKSSKN